MLSHAINHQLTNWLGLRIVRVKDHEALLGQSAGQMRRLANSPLAIERIARLGRLLHPQEARGVRKVRLGASNDCGYVCLDDFAGIEGVLSLGIAAEVSWDAEMAERGLTIHQYAATPPATLDTFTQVLAEFHSFNNVLDDAWFEEALAVLTKLNEKFAVVHVHANNYRPLLAIGNVLFPQVLEVTYASRAEYSFADCDEAFPSPLDSPNWPAAPDYGLGRFVY